MNTSNRHYEELDFSEHFQKDFADGSFMHFEKTDSCSMSRIIQGETFHRETKVAGKQTCSKPIQIAIKGLGWITTGFWDE